MKTNFGGRRRAARKVRIGLLVLAGFALVPGIWALASPESFFKEFPGFGFAWVAVFPPYNEHLVRDVGAAYTGFGALLLAAALVMDRRLSQAALGAWLVFSIPHLYFHVSHADWSETSDRTQAVAHALTVLIPLLLIPLIRRSNRSSI